MHTDGGGGGTATDLDGEREHEVYKMEAKLLTVFAGSEVVRSSENVVAGASTVAMVFTLAQAPSIARERAKGVRRGR